jgi:hypothetical protein
MSANKAEKQEAGSETGFGSVFNDAGGAPASGTEFQTNFGAENTAMSEIFKSSGAGGDEKKKRLYFLGAAGAALVLCVGALMYLLEEDGSDVAMNEETPIAAPTNQVKPAAPATTPDVSVADEGEEATDEVDEETEPSATSDVSAPSTVNNITTYAYNEKSGGPVVSAKAGAVIEVSRSADFSVPYVTGTAKNGSFRIPNPPPGDIYWREQGSATASKITVTAPPSLSLSFKAPSQMAAGESLSWTADGQVAFFRVEFSADPNFENIANVLATAKNSIAIKEVGAGKYHVRLAAFNTTAGRWEYSTPSAVEVK